MVIRLAAVAFGAGLAILLTAGALRLWGPVNAGLTRLGQDFRPTPAVSLLDSLPALEGLAGLEAFSLRLPPGTRATPDRSLWLTDSLDAVAFDFHSERFPFDSARLYLWDGDSLRSRTLHRPGTHSWSVPARRRVSGWTEIAGAYASYPPLFNPARAPGPVSAFERVEGDVIHAIADDYDMRAGGALKPDTTYPAPGDGELTLLARGTALAVINPAPEAARIRIVAPRGAAVRCHAAAGTVSVYRGALRGGGPFLAYTGAGEPACFLGRCRDRQRAFFLLERARGEARP